MPETPTTRKKVIPWLIAGIVVVGILLSICRITLVIPAILYGRYGGRG